MPSLPGAIGDVHFGHVGKPLPDFTENDELRDEEDPDDEDAKDGAPEVWAMIGVERSAIEKD